MLFYLKSAGFDLQIVFLEYIYIIHKVYIIHIIALCHPLYISNVSIEIVISI